ncbi:MAG TPA: hypothetical protein VMT46_19185 [Anaerolineaceae bacterium]|nr:hypothetical protein [Anaerolineaceae bacterium]
MNHVTLLTRGFSTLVSLYPLHFREEFGEEMEAVFSAQVDDQDDYGPLPIVAICLHEIPDLLINLLREHLSEFARRSGLGNIFQGKPVPNLLWWGALVFGLGSGIGKTIGLLTGLSTLKFGDYTFWAVLASFLSALLFTGAQTWLFWQGSSQRENKWGFLVPVVGATLTSLLTLLLSIRYMPMGPLYDRGEWWFWAIDWPLLSTMLWGLVFGALFGWVYQGRQAIFRFAAIGAMGRALAFILWQGSMAITYRVFHITDELPHFVAVNVWFLLWNLVLVILGGMAFGALIGWQASREEKHSPMDGVAV